jgi:hypothetical protein
MFKIDSEGATVDNLFTEGNPQAGVPATKVSDEWLNAVQTELVNILLARGIALDKAKSSQISEWLQKGIDEWHSNLTYTKDSVCQINGKFYVSQSDDNLNHNPETDDGTYWKSKLILSEVNLETDNAPARVNMARKEDGVDGLILAEKIISGKDDQGNNTDFVKTVYTINNAVSKVGELNTYVKSGNDWYKTIKITPNRFQAANFGNELYYNSQASNFDVDINLSHGFRGLIEIWARGGGNTGHKQEVYMVSADYTNIQATTVKSFQTGGATMFEASFISGWGGQILRLSVYGRSDNANVDVVALPFSCNLTI